MPIRINLLAEAQAAEEQRRKDPVKLAACLAGFVVFLIALWAMTLQFKIMAAGSDLNGLGTKWKSIEQRYNEVVQRKRQAIEMEEKLAALDRLTTNRFLWANALNGFQQTLNGLDGVQLARLRTEQTFVGLEENKPRAVPGAADSKTVSATEKISVTLEAIDFSPQPGSHVNKFKEAIASAPYFKKTLQTNGVLLTSLGPPQVNEMVGTAFVKFTLQCFFPKRCANNMKNLPREKKERIVLIAVGTIVVLVATWYGLIGAQKKKLEETRKNVSEQQTRVDNGHRLLNAATDVERRVAASAQKLETIEAGMATGDMYSWIILKVNKFKMGYKVEIPQFSREITGEVGILPKFPYKAATFNVRGTAHFHDFGRFLADFENSFPYLRVQNLELEPAGSSSATSTEEPEKIAFRLEIVALINPNTR